MKKILIVLLTVALLFSGCSTTNQTLKNENSQLKNKVTQLQKELSIQKTENNKTIESDKQNQSISINYVENTDKKRFVENGCYLSGLPMNDSIKLNSINKNTVITVLDTAAVENVRWLYVSIPVYDTPANCKGWVKESDTAAYTKDKISSVQYGVEIKEGENEYETDNFEDIKATKPGRTSKGDRGYIIEKKEGYVKVGCPGGKTVWMLETSIIYPEAD